MIDSYEIHFNKEAEEVEVSQFIAFKKAVLQKDYTDLIVLAHGWNNDIEEAKDLYGRLLEQISASIDEKNDVSKRFASLHVFWPSKKFAKRELISGGAASTGDSDDIEKERIINEWAQMEELLDDPTASMAYHRILDGLKRSADADELSPEFVKILSMLMPLEEDGELFTNLSDTKIKEFIQDGSLPYLQPEDESGMALGIDADSASEDGYALGFFNSLNQGISNLMNVTTYYTMKARAGEIGAALNAKLSEIKAIKSKINIHLIGHSFGARLVTSALFGPHNLQVKTLALIQAAFSHYSFADNYDGSKVGYFRKVLTENKITGALLITHTRADRAVGLAYALASRLAGQTGSNVGGIDSLYGGLGGNGAQKTPEIDNTINLVVAARENKFKAGESYNLLSDDIIGGHSDIVKPEVAKALVNAFFI